MSAHHNHPKKWHISSLAKPMTKSELISAIAEHTDKKKNDVASVIQAFAELMELHLSKKGPGSFVLPNAFKAEVVIKPATPAKNGVNPFTKAPMMIPAKPESRKVKIKALTHLNKKAND
jgi:nucleoid DNA-binding protein